MMAGRDEHRRREEVALDREIGELAREIEPARDLWPAIEARLETDEAESGRSYWLRAGLAAAVCAAVLLPFLLREQPDPARTVPMAAVPTSTQPAPELRLRNAAAINFEPGMAYRTARAELVDLLEARLAQLAPEEREIVLTNIETIRAALQRIDEALEENPDDPLLQELLLKTFQAELDVMARVNGLTAPAQRRKDL